MNSLPNDPFERALLAAAGVRYCGTCARSFTRDDGSSEVCGAGVDDGALADGVTGVNPIWAERKYGRARIAALLAGDAATPEGADCGNMPSTDGAECALWQPRPYRAP